MASGPYVDKFDGVFSAQYPEEGSAQWILPVAPPYSANIQAGSAPLEPTQTARGMKCTDLANLTNENDRERACASAFWTSAMGPEDELSHIAQPSNAPLAAGIARKEKFAFALGRYVCPFQCGDLRYEQEFSNMPIQIDPTSPKVAIIVNDTWEWYDNLDALHESDEYRKLLTGYSGSIEAGVWRDLEQLRDTRADFAALTKADQEKSDHEMYNNASILGLGQPETHIARAAQHSVQQDVKCVHKGSEIPYQWADKEHIPSDFGSKPTLWLNALDAPGECKVTTTMKTPSGAETLSSVVSTDNVPATLQAQLAAIEAGNVAELGALTTMDTGAGTAPSSSVEAIVNEIDNANIVTISGQTQQLEREVSQLENRQRAIDDANIDAISV